MALMYTWEMIDHCDLYLKRSFKLQECFLEFLWFGSTHLYMPLPIILSLCVSRIVLEMCLGVHGTSATAEDVCFIEFMHSHTFHASCKGKPGTCMYCVTFHAWQSESH